MAAAAGWRGSAEAARGEGWEEEGGEMAAAPGVAQARAGRSEGLALAEVSGAAAEGWWLPAPLARAGEELVRPSARRGSSWSYRRRVTMCRWR